MAEYLPALLPPIESVEIVVLAGLNPNRVDDYMQVAATAPVFRVIGNGAVRIASLWRQLPGGEQMRCHIPPFGLRFWLGSEIVCQASICWKCNNIFGVAEGRKFAYEFDAGSVISQELLTELQRRTNFPNDALRLQD